MMKIFIIILSLYSLMYATVAPENILTKSCLNSYFNTYKSQKDHKAFVYARESETGKDRCGWGYGYESVKEAKKGAMKQCTGFQLNAECIIVDTDGEYLVKEGDFTTIIQPDDTPLTSEEKEKLVEEAKVLIRGNCLPFFKDYLDDKRHKAFAYSFDADGTYACGKIYNTSTMVAAHKGALKGCDNNKQKRGTQKPKSPCKVYAKGDTIILEAKDFALVKVEKELSDEVYNAVKEKKNKSANTKPIDMNKPQPLKKTLQITADTLNKDLPSMMDEELRLDKVHAEGYKMIFRYTLVNFTPQSMSGEKLKSLMYEDIKTQVCTDKDSKMMLKKGMLVDYVYNGKNKKHITIFTFDAKTCGYLTNVEQIKKNILNMIKKKEK